MPPVLRRLVATFEYDAPGRRIRATHYDGNEKSIISDTLFYHYDQRVVVEHDYDETPACRRWRAGSWTARHAWTST